MSLYDIISIVRGEKLFNNLSLKTNVELLDIIVSKESKETIELSIIDFKVALFIKELKITNINDGYKINEIRLEKNIL